MDQESVQAQGVSMTTVGRKSWTAHIGVALFGLLLLLCFVPSAWSDSRGYGMAVLILVSSFIVYKVLLNRSYHLYYDEIGVWVYAGILPWKKSVQGVKWRDLDVAVYFPNLWSWLFKSYSLRIGHRFTKAIEINLSPAIPGIATCGAGLAMPAR